MVDYSTRAGAGPLFDMERDMEIVPTRRDQLFEPPKSPKSWSQKLVSPKGLGLETSPRRGARFH